MQYYNYKVKDNLSDQLKECSSLNEIIAKTNQIYNLDKKLGVMSKTIVIKSIKEVVKICDLKKRNNG